MATEKQLQAIKKMASVVGHKVDVEALKGAGNEELNEVFNKLRKKLEDLNGGNKRQESKAADSFDRIRFGMAVKIVAQSYAHRGKQVFGGDFKADVKDMYIKIGLAETHCKDYSSVYEADDFDDEDDVKADLARKYRGE